MFPAREAGELLGRTYEGVRRRRDQKGLGPAHGNEKPKKRLRREHSQTGEEPREETVPPPSRPKCRFCRRVCAWPCCGPDRRESAASLRRRRKSGRGNP